MYLWSSSSDIVPLDLNVKAGTVIVNTPRWVVGPNFLTTHVFSGATLGGTGYANQATLVDGVAVLAPGSSGDPTVYATASLALADGAILDFDASYAGNDSIQVNGNVSFGAGATVAFHGPGVAMGDHVLLHATGTISPLPVWNIELTDGWHADGIVLRGQDIVLVNVVPEPGSLALLGVAGALSLLRRRG